jgi:hypothetical protein
MMMNKMLLFFVCSLFFDCSTSVTHAQWAGGKIEQPGTYRLSDGNLIIRIYIENNFVRYVAEDKEGELIRYNYNISVYQQWAFYLDKKRDFWVFSSDIGHSVWRKSGSVYFEHTFDRMLARTEVPDEVYQNCKHFFYERE